MCWGEGHLSGLLKMIVCIAHERSDYLILCDTFYDLSWTNCMTRQGGEIGRRRARWCLALPPISNVEMSQHWH